MTLPVISTPSLADGEALPTNPKRRHALGWLVAAGLGNAALVAQAAVPSAPANASAAPGLCTDEWPDWSMFRTNFVANDGRVIDPDTPRAQTVSEAQAYGLFFALVANDRPSFEKILKWTENNLAGGDLTARLPAWIWGRRDDGNWGVVDANPASDADLWIVYALAEAGRLWRDPRLTALSTVMAERMLRESIFKLPGLGLTLLPGPQGFLVGVERWRLNPSYLPLHLLRWLVKNQKNPAWSEVVATSRKIILSSVPKGFAPDWIAYQAGHGFQVDDGKGPVGGYDAIRVYLWAGMLNPSDPLSRPLLEALTPMAKSVAKNGYPPETVNILTGEGPQPAPSGFSAALLPYLQAKGDKATLQAQLTRLQAKPIRPKAYYEQALNLFGMGWYQGYFKFAADGSLRPKWKTPCARTV